VPPFRRDDEEDKVELEGRVNIDEFNIDELFDSGILNAQEVAASSSSDPFGESDDDQLSDLEDQLGL
jgi:hypothetical protein